MPSFTVPHPCVFCGKKAEFELTDEQNQQLIDYLAADSFELIQDGLPSWTPGMREALLTGTDESCWEAVLGDPIE